MSMLFSSGYSSILLNGVPGRQFKCKRGVRQGDPLSPLLFVLAAKLLQYVINDAFQNGHLNMPLPHSSKDFPVVQYADDTILIMEANVSQVTYLKGLLDTFASSIGLRVNFHKSSMVPINVPEATLASLAAAFGCQTASMPFTY